MDWIECKINVHYLYDKDYQVAHEEMKALFADVHCTFIRYSNLSPLCDIKIDLGVLMKLILKVTIQVHPNYF